MSIWYIKTNNGNDSTTGNSWAAAWQTWQTGSTAARIAAGDTIRIEQSPVPTSMGQNGRWTQGPLTQSTSNIVNSTNTNPCRVTVTAHGYSNDDVIQLRAHTTNTNANGLWRITVNDSSNFTLNDCSSNGTGGATGTVVKLNAKTVLLDSSVTKSICPCEYAWTAGAAAGTSTLSQDITLWREGNAAAKFAMTADAGVGVIGYYTLPVTLNLSNYKQVSFWAMNSVATNQGDYTIGLCSDTTGTVTVNSIPVPAMAASNARWHAFTVNTGAALGSAISSVSLIQGVDKGACNMWVDNILACKAVDAADSLTLNSVISKNSLAQGGTEGWYPIQSITGRIISLDERTVQLPNILTLSYGGDSSTQTLYKRECYLTPIGTSAGASSTIQSTKAGTLGNVITWSGGWDSTSNTQTGETFYDGRNTWGINGPIHSYVRFDHLSFVRYYYCLGMYATNTDATNIQTLAAGERGVMVTITNNNFTAYQGTAIVGCNIGWQADSNLGQAKVTLKQMDMCDNAYYQTTARVPSGVWNVSSMSGCKAAWSISSGVATILGCTFKANSTNSVQTPAGGGSISLVNCVFGTGAGDALSITSSNLDGRIYSQAHNNIATNHYILSDSASITDQTTTLYSTDPLAWDFSITAAARSIYYPMTMKLCRVPVTVANKLITVTANVMKSHATNCAAKLFIQGGQIGGVPDNLSFSVADSTNWQQISATCTPTAVGEIEVEAWAWYAAAAGHVYVDNTLTVTQEP